MTTRLLKDILPVGHSLNASTVRNHLCRWRSVLTLRLKLIQVFFPAAPRLGTCPAVKTRLCGYRWWLCSRSDDKSVILNYYREVFSVGAPADTRRFGFVQKDDCHPNAAHDPPFSAGMQANQQIFFVRRRDNLRTSSSVCT